MKTILSALLLISRIAAAGGEDPSWLVPSFYSAAGRERAVSFSAVFRTEFRSLEQLGRLSETEKELFPRDRMESTLKFLFGPLTHRNLGGPQKGTDVRIDWAGARLEGGRVLLPFEYKAIWIVDERLGNSLEIPFPFTRTDLFTAKWKRCTDSDPGHQTEGFYWYFWDPSRPGCDHKAGTHYQQLRVALGEFTTIQKNSAPEYARMLRSTGRDGRLQASFAFGYIEDPADPDPEADGDGGVREYRSFVSDARRLLGAGFRETPILQGEYRSAPRPERQIGHRFEGRLHGAEVVINVVAAAGIDQMQLFAKSFAHDHDAFFGWFGHSRVGSGFDAQNFWNMVVRAPDYYSVTPNYQLVYWAGCNSYSYYTLPFFEFKAHVAGGADPAGTKGLDIIANGLPSYFSLNADNAAIVLRQLLRWPERPAYQSIVDELEERARSFGTRVLVAVLGDEDNAAE